MSDPPLPEPSEDTDRFWAACDEKRFVVQECNDCGHRRFYPASTCPQCWNDEWAEVEMEGDGRVVSYTIVHRPPSDAFTGETPYVVALISVDGDVTVMSNIIAPPDSVSVGEAVELVWQERNGRYLYQFQPVVD